MYIYTYIYIYIYITCMLSPNGYITLWMYICMWLWIKYIGVLQFNCHSPELWVAEKHRT